jgi:hypothetical protein
MIMIAMMKLLSVLFTEITNILLISSESKSLDIIKDFVALTVVAQLDNFYALTIHDNTVRERVEGKVMLYDQSKVEAAKQGLGHKIGHFFFSIDLSIYVSFYFYFMPFLVLFLSMYSYMIDQVTELIS